MELGVQHHVVLEHHDAPRAAVDGEPPGLPVLQGERGLPPHRRAAGDEMPGDGRVVELGSVEIEDELERDVEPSELARHMGDAVRERLDREHEHGVDAEIMHERGRSARHATRPARMRGRGAGSATGIVTSSIGTGWVQSMPSAVMAQRQAIASTPAARARTNARA